MSLFSKRLEKIRLGDSSSNLEQDAKSIFEKLDKKEIISFILVNYKDIHAIYVGMGATNSFGRLWKNENYEQIFIDCFEDYFKMHPFITRLLSDSASSN